MMMDLLRSMMLHVLLPMLNYLSLYAGLLQIITLPVLFLLPKLQIQ